MFISDRLSIRVGWIKELVINYPIHIFGSPTPAYNTITLYHVPVYLRIDKAFFTDTTTFNYFVKESMDDYFYNVVRQNGHDIVNKDSIEFILDHEQFK